MQWFFCCHLSLPPPSMSSFHWPPWVFKPAVTKTIIYTWNSLSGVSLKHERNILSRRQLFQLCSFRFETGFDCSKQAFSVLNHLVVHLIASECIIDVMMKENFVCWQLDSYVNVSIAMQDLFRWFLTAL